MSIGRLTWASVFAVLVGITVRVQDLRNVSSPVFDEDRYISSARVLIGSEYFSGHPQWEGVSPAIARSPDPNFFHPPLGKLLIGASILLFGDNALAWRLPALICGLATLLVFYLLALRVFQDPGQAWFATALLSLEFLNILHSRTAMLDIFICLSVVGCFLGYYILTHESRIRGMAIMSIFLFFGISVKHVSLLVVPAVILTELLRAKNQPGAKTQITLIVSAGMVSGVFYLLWSLYYKEFTFIEWVRLQIDANRSLVGTMAPHQYASTPSQWIFNGRPIWYFFERTTAQSRGLLAWGNPIIWWSLVPALFTFCRPAAQRLKNQMIPAAVIFIVFYIFSMFLILRVRVGFLYYMVPLTPFICLVVAAAVFEWQRRWKYTQVMMLSIATLLLVWFFPVLSGQLVSQTWIDSIIEITRN